MSSNKTLYLVRHAQGFHNLSIENHSIHDPQLTDLGKEQCRILGDNFPYSSSVDLIVVSPIKRTIYTAILSFWPLIQQKKLKIIALPEIQETSDLPCDTGSSKSELEREFAAYNVDLSRVQEGWNSNTGKWAPTAPRISERGREARLWLRDRPEKNIIVVTHGGFLHYFTDDWMGLKHLEGSHSFFSAIVSNLILPSCWMLTNVKAGSGWLNTEWRAYNFVPDSGDKALLTETPESRQRRAGHEHPLSEAEQRNIRETAIRTWVSLGYIKAESEAQKDEHKTAPLEAKAEETVSA
jgi:broad specificity phosphatase PhoE